MSRKITVKCFCASDGICNRNAIKNPPSAIRQTAEGIYSVCRKSLFFQKVLVLNPYPQTPFPGKGAILLGLPPLDPVGGYAPATPFLYNQEVYRQSALPREKAHGAVSYLFFLYRLQLVKILLHRAVLHDIIHILCRCRVEIRLEPCYTRTARCKILIRNIIL